jgi:integrase
MIQSVSNRHRSVPLQNTITKIGKGYPDKLVIFKITASPFWWVRYYTQKRIIKKSTKTENQKDAVKFAIKFYEDILLRERNLMPIGSSPSFERCSQELLAEQNQKIERGELNKKLNENDKTILKKHLNPFFKGMDIRGISYKHINAYLAECNKTHHLSPGSLKKHTNLLSKILKLAMRENLIDRMPMMPSIKLSDSPRGWFSIKEYDELRKKLQELIDKGVVVRGQQITKELSYLVTFMVNTFLRPSDLKNLRHRNIEVVENEQKYLRITTEQSKTENLPIVSMEFAINIYKDILNLRIESKKDDYVFFPNISNRDRAMKIMSSQFNEVLKYADLKNSSSGEPRTLYSLRHTAIMLRLTKGDHIDLLTLARNARTSVDMIERFYAKPLSAEMNVDKLQSMRSKK